MQLLIFVSTLVLISNLSQASSLCSDLNGKWEADWSNNYGGHIMDLTFDSSCLTLVQYDQARDSSGKTSSANDRLDVNPDWTFKKRWQAGSDGEWYSLLGRTRWVNTVFVNENQLFREHDGALTWDFIETTELVSGKLHTKQVRKFPIEGHQFVHEEYWHR